MVLIFITGLLLVLFIVLYLIINDLSDKRTIKKYGNLVVLNSVWMHSDVHGKSWEPIYVKITNNKTYKGKRYVTYMDLSTGDEFTCNVIDFFNNFTYKHN